MGGPTTFGQVSDRIAGARSALEHAGRDPADLVVVETTGLTVAEGRRAGRAVAYRPVAARPACSAPTICSPSGCCSAACTGSAVPDDLAIVGYDDIEFAEAAAVPLTSVAQPSELLGRTAVDLLLDEVAAGPETRAPPRRLHPGARGALLHPGARAERLPPEWLGDVRSRPADGGAGPGPEVQDAAGTVVGRSARSASICSRDLPVVSGIAK